MQPIFIKKSKHDPTSIKHIDMNHVMVCAEFPGATQEQLTEIHNWLGQRNWIPITGPGDELNNVWYGTFKHQMLEKDCRAIAAKSFIEASKNYCKVELGILWGANKPALNGLTLLG
jgi:hypothetical protein